MFFDNLAPHSSSFHLKRVKKKLTNFIYIIQTSELLNLNCLKLSCNQIRALLHVFICQFSDFRCSSQILTTFVSISIVGAVPESAPQALPYAPFHLVPRQRSR